MFAQKQAEQERSAEQYVTEGHIHIDPHEGAYYVSKGDRYCWLYIQDYGLDSRKTIKLTSFSGGSLEDAYKLLEYGYSQDISSNIPLDVVFSIAENNGTFQLLKADSVSLTPRNASTKTKVHLEIGMGYFDAEGKFKNDTLKMTITPAEPKGNKFLSPCDSV